MDHERSTDHKLSTAYALATANVLPLRVYRLRGTQVEMGRQFGQLAATDGGFQAAIDLYAERPTMAATMIAAGMPHRQRRTVERIVDTVFARQRRRLHRIRTGHFADYAQRTAAGFAELGLPADRVSATFVMEALQNMVGVVGRTSMFTKPLQVAAVPMCSAVAVWGAATSDEALRHARNFDFPGGSIWDRAPAVVFCDPDDGLRYGFVTTRGLDAPGITCFNEAGLTLSVHTRFHREVGWSGPSVIDLGHEIIRTCDTLDSAIETGRRLGATSTWGLLISSASQNRAAVLETTAKRTAVTLSDSADTHLTCTNRYLSSELRPGEVVASPDFATDSDDRQCQLERFVEDHRGSIDSAALQEVLGDLGAIDQTDLSDDIVRLCGHSVVAHHSVASIVSNPQARSIDVSVGATPTGFGPYATVPWSWDGPVGVVGVVDDEQIGIGPIRGRDHRGRPLALDERAVSYEIAEVVQRHLGGATPSTTRAAIESLCARVPNEPNLRRFAAQLALMCGDPGRAVTHVDHALTLEGTPGARAKLLLARSRAHHSLGDPVAAATDRDEVIALGRDSAPFEFAAAQREQAKALSASALRKLSIDILHLDAR